MWVVRPEDIKLVAKEDGMLQGEIQSVTFKGVHYEMIIQSTGLKWAVHSTLMEPVGTMIGLRILPNDIHVMKKSNGVLSSDIHAVKEENGTFLDSSDMIKGVNAEWKEIGMHIHTLFGWQFL